MTGLPERGQRVRTMCPMNCHPTLCGMQVTVTGEKSVEIEGDPDNPDSRGFLCMRGNAAHQIVGNPARLRSPLIRTGPGPDAFRQASWDEAFDRIEAAMRSAGREAVGFWQGHGNMANDYGVGLKRGQMERFANLYGCQHWNPAMICWGLGGFGVGLTGALATSTKEDMGRNSDLIVLWGANTVSQAHTIRHVEEARQRGARVITIDVRRTEASALAHRKVILRPGSDAALALAMMHVMIRDDLVDRDFIDAHTLGYDDLATHVAEWTPPRAEARTGVPADEIEALAREYATAGPAMIVLGGSSIHKGANGWHAARAISCLPALKGDYGRPGGGLGPRHGARSHGAGFTDISARDRRPPGRYVPNQMSRIVDALEEGTVRVLFALGANMLSAFPDAGRMGRALAGLDLLVVYDIFMNETARQAAGIVLPGTIWLEEVGAKATNSHVYLTERVLEPAGEARALFTIYQELGRRLGVDDVYPWPDQEAALDAVLDHPGTGHVTVAALRAADGKAPLAISHVAYPDRLFDTPSGRIEFVSERARLMGLPALPVAPDPVPRGHPLTLAHGRTFAHFHSFYDAGRALPALAEREPAPALWLAPADAGARGIANGAGVRVWNERGAFEAQALVTPRVPAGTVWIRDGWPGLNALTDGAPVLPNGALGAFAFSVGQSGFGAAVEVAPL